jgi:putative membrane protein
MQALAWIIRIAIVLVLVWFAVRNSQPVTLHGLPEQSWQAPLVFVVLVAFVAGVVIGLTAWLPTVVRQRREVSRLKKALAAAPVPAPIPPAGAAPAPPPSPPAPAPLPPQLPPGPHGI